MSKINIALLSGGISGEREISLRTGQEIYNALDKNKYKVYQYDPKTDLKQFFIDALKKKFDLVFPALHGPFGEDGKLQGLLDMIGLPYVFSGTLASALAMNKYKTKIIAKNAGLDTVLDVVLKKNDKFNLDNIIKKLSWPMVVKPMELGSSVGMAIVNNKKNLIKAVKEAFCYDSEIILEKFISGRELTVAIMENKNIKPLPVIEIIPKISAWFDYRAKYENGGSDEVCPARISINAKNKIQALAIKIYLAVGCKDLARADFIYSQDKFYFLEINTIPGMTSASLVPKAAKVAGMEFSKFLDKLIAGALKY